jgi:mono/diheme cytochrome c family protein
MFKMLPPSSALGLLLSGFAALPAAAAPDFHADVAPILRDYCSACHSGKELEGELNLETFAALKKGGEHGSPLSAKSGEPSLMGKVIRGKKPAMPPKKEPQPTEADLLVLEAWLKAGAPGPTAPDVSILTLVTVPDLPLKTRAPKALTALAVSPDGHTHAVARYGVVELLENPGGGVRRRFEGLPGKVTHLAFSPDGSRLAAATGVASISGAVHCWNLAGDASPILFEGAHRDLVYAVRWSPDGRTLATGGYDSKIVLWDAASGKPVRTLNGHNGAIFSLAFSPDGSLLASASADQTIKVWRMRDGERLDTLKEPQGEQFSVSFTPDGKHLVAAGADRRIRIWTLKSREKTELNPLLESRYAHEAAITSMSILPSGDRLLSAALDRSLKVWSLPGLDLLEVLPSQPDTVTSLQQLPGGGVLLARMDGSTEAIHLGTPSPEGPKSSGLTLANAHNPSSAGPDVAAPKTVPPFLTEQEPNNRATEAQPIALPAEIRGSISQHGDVDTFKFEARKGEDWVFEVFAAREKSPLDSRIEVLDSAGKPIERVVLQSLRSSWLSFRGKDSTTSGDFRVQHYPEMELNEFLYCNGEVVKLWMYPRGPDSGFLVYPGSGSRHSFFGTTPIAHPLGEVVYTVRPLPPGTQPPANGLPVFRLPYENDDDSERDAGKDSMLNFNAPADGTYLLRIGDTRGFGEEKSTYRLVCRQASPDFEVSIAAGAKPSISPGSGREFQLKIKRKDGFEGEVRVEVEGLPPGFHAPSPLLFEAGQNSLLGVIYASADAKAPAEDVASASKLSATALVHGKEIRHELAGFGEIKLGGQPKVKVEVTQTASEGGQQVLTIHPGETITARIKATRIDFKERIELGGEDSGRNLPHGVYVDNIGLNGLLIPEGETERDFFLTAAKWVPESERLIFFRAKGDGGQPTPPVLLRVRKR